MLKGRRVGTLTAGITLVVFGLLFLARLVFPAITWRLLLSLWPVILIFLGTEVLVSYFINRPEIMRYDAGAVFLLVMLSFFAVGMAGAETLIDNAPLFFPR